MWKVFILLIKVIFFVKVGLILGYLENLVN